MARPGYPDTRPAHYFKVNNNMNQSVLKQSVVHEIFRSGDSDYMVSLARGLHVIQAFCDDGRGQLTIA